MTQEELNDVRSKVLVGLRSAQELVESKNDSIKHIMEIISHSYKSLLPLGFEEKGKVEDERVRFLVDEMEYYFHQL